MGAALGGLSAMILLLGAACGPSPANCSEEEKCDGVCVDFQNDDDNCGECGNACGTGYHCSAGDCVYGETCTEGDSEACYSGAAGTEDVGPCHGGTRTCQAGGTWGNCEGEVAPKTEDCGNGVDDDCNGTVDDDVDHDGDGFSSCSGGDCCDVMGSECSTPDLVNPGAFEVPGNGVDDDCNGTVDETFTGCDGALPSNSSDPLQYAAAMDLCQTTTENGNTWGVISGEFTLTSGTGSPAADARSIRPGFGTGTAVQFGQSLAVLSTGHAADSSDTNPAYAAFQVGEDMGTSGGVPSDWLAANGNNFPNAPGCPEPGGGTVANDPVMLKLRIRVPTNARSFSLSSKFFSSEYPEWVCSPYNDFFIILLDSTFNGDPPNPADKNLAIYTAPDDSEYPVGVNLAFGDTGLFTDCLNGETGCGDDTAVVGNSTTCTGTGGLAGTGFDVANPDGGGLPGWCGDSNLAGGATGWLTTNGNVVPGEIITLRFAIWDTGDHIYDSLVLLDNFQWSVEGSDPGTIID